MADEIISAVIAGILGLAGGLIAGPFSSEIWNLLFGPRLDLDLTEEGSRVRTQHRDPASEAIVSEAVFVRVRVRNIGRGVAQACRAYLTKIEKKNECDRFITTEYAESMQLSWSAQGDGSKELDIPRGIEQYIDVVRSNSKSPRLFQPTVVSLFLYDKVLAQPGTYRLEVLVSGDRVAPKFCKIIVTHTGKWDEVTVATVAKEPGSGMDGLAESAF
jgi:hypothetical protein